MFGDMCHKDRTQFLQLKSEYFFVSILQVWFFPTILATVLLICCVNACVSLHDVNLM